MFERNLHAVALRSLTWSEIPKLHIKLFYVNVNWTKIFYQLKQYNDKYGVWIWDTVMVHMI